MSVLKTFAMSSVRGSINNTKRWCVLLKRIVNHQPRCGSYDVLLDLIAYSVLRLCVCYFGLQTLAFKDKFYSQNNSTKPLLVAGAVD